MSTEAPYSNREHNEFRRENREMYENLVKMLEKMSTTDAVFRKSVESLFVRVSNNSGAIEELWKAYESNKKHNEMLEDVMSFSKVTKWMVGLIVGGGTIYSIIKVFLMENYR